MSTDKSKKIDIEVKKIHTEIKKSNLVLREKMKDIQDELIEWNLIGGIENGEGSNGFMR